MPRPGPGRSLRCHGPTSCSSLTAAAAGGGGRGAGSETAAPLGTGPSLPGAISQAVPPLFTSVPALQDPGTETGHRGSGQGAPSRGRARPLPCPSASSRGFYARNARSDWSAGRRGGERPGPVVHAASAETPERPLPIRGSEVNNLHPLSEAARPALPRSHAPLFDARARRWAGEHHLRPLLGLKADTSILDDLTAHPESLFTVIVSGVTTGCPDGHLGGVSPTSGFCRAWIGQLPAWPKRGPRSFDLHVQSTSSGGLVRGAPWSLQCRPRL